MKLFVFIVFQLLMEIQSYKFPNVKVSPNVIRESSSVKISCETDPQSLLNTCHFYINREEKNMKNSSSCELELTGAEVLRWAAVKSPESLNIYCYYTIINMNSIIPSSDSDPATVTVLVLSSTTTEQSTTTAVRTLSSSATVMSTSETTTYSKTILTSTTTEQSTTTAVETLSSSATLMSTSETTTYSKTTDLQFNTNPPNSTAKKTMYIFFIVLASIGVILSGLMVLICLSQFACKKRRKQNKMRLTKPDAAIQGMVISCSGPAETHSLITSVPSTSQPISGGLDHPESHQDSTPTKHIVSVNLFYEPSDGLINNEQKQRNQKENEEVYHLYCTIPENQFTQTQEIKTRVW